MKTCAQCRCEKPFDAFQTRRASKDGRTARCRDCLKVYDAKRYRDTPHRRERLDAYNKSPKGRAMQHPLKKAWAMRNPEKRAAHVAVGNAVRDGKLIKPDACQGCGHIGRLEAHHKDYSEPLKVVWLCIPCHKEMHKELPF